MSLVQQFTNESFHVDVSFSVKNRGLFMDASTCTKVICVAPFACQIRIKTNTMKTSINGSEGLVCNYLHHFDIRTLAFGIKKIMTRSTNKKENYNVGFSWCDKIREEKRVGMEL